MSEPISVSPEIAVPSGASRTPYLWQAVLAIIGGRWYVVESPSMGTAAPVGTLLWVHPEPFRSIHVGQIVTFHPPSEPRETYSHRVVAIDPGGALVTRVDINGAREGWGPAGLAAGCAADFALTPAPRPRNASNGTSFAR